MSESITNVKVAARPGYFSYYEEHDHVEDTCDGSNNENLCLRDQLTVCTER